MRTRILALLALTAAAATPTAAAATAPTARAIASESGPLSNETTVTYWAYAATSTPVRSGPSASARRIDTVHLLTEDGFPEDYLVLAQRVYPRRTWFEIRLPGRPNGRIGWVPEQALGALHVSHDHLVVNELRRRLTLYRWGKAIFSAPVGVGKPSTPTPTGHYWIREKFQVVSDPFYGPYAFGTADYSTLSDWPHGGVVGIHGTDAPSLIPGDPSHGCIRMKDADITRLWPLLRIGTPLTIK